MRVLVTGGAGYIGSVVVEALLASGAERVVVLDDLSKGHSASVPPEALLEQGDIGDASLVSALCRDERLDGVVHMAAYSQVGESVEQPGKYYENNLARALAMMEGVLTAGVRRLVFSSTAAVYGEPAVSPITEDCPTEPTNPYGETKLAFEKALRWFERAHSLRYASLRYFNAAGATMRNGEQHAPETHLIPIVLAAARGLRDAVAIHGQDYATPDGTCIRDYIHVSDLADAHVLALGALAQGSRTYNLGCGGGFSVRQVVEVAERVTGRKIPTLAAPRRPGDPAVLVASSERIRRELGWRPVKQGLDSIIEDAWAWSLAHPLGHDVATTVVP
jgi:UDP-glucose 4-epimerase